MIAYLISTIFLASQAYAQPKTAEDIINTIDKLYRSDGSESVIEMEIKTPEWQRTMKIKMFSSGTDKTFVEVLEPKKDKGIKTLRIGKEMWNYFPRINKTMKIPPSMMMGSWMGSDFTNDDLVREVSLLNDYKIRLLPVDKSVDSSVRLELLAKPDVPTVWAKIIVAVNSDDVLPVSQQFYDEKEVLLRTISFAKPALLGGRKIPTEMIVQPANKPGNSTTIRYIEAAFDKKISDSVFSVRNLQSK